MILKLKNSLSNLETCSGIKIFYITVRTISSLKKSKKYSHTICLPVTNFPSYVQSKNRVQLDQKIEKESDFNSLYEWQKININGPKYVLHDGPPYANGSAHMGHAINKILKDIAIRHQLLKGYKIHFKPGWDCHGLPIELKALSKCETDWRNIPVSELRKKAKDFAIESIEKQKAVFKNWGLLVDWEKDCYYTFDKIYVQNQIKLFYELYRKGLIYRDLKPVYWSPSTRTALAEAELEYNSNHVSKAIIIRTKLDVSQLKIKVPFNNLFALIWTTTPWTLPANKAIAYSCNFDYSIVKIIDNSSNLFLIASNLVSTFETLIQKSVTVISTFSGSNLEGLKYEHFYYKNNYLSFIKGTHISSTKGTGLVHIAPAHGPEDFVLGLQYNLPTDCIIDENGCYTSAAGELEGLSVIGSGNDKIVDLLRDDILHIEQYEHSYPYDWRTKSPVVIRASEQWFMNCELLKETATKLIENVTIQPNRYSNRLSSLLKTRPFWCISRQRVWGVPIPVLYDKRTNQPIINENLINHYCKLIDQHDVDFWWNLSIEELLPVNSYIYNLEHIRKGEDILDIWFDSGISWFNVLDNDKVADMYLEGIDQCTGWFQSSLLTSVAYRNKAPFKNIFIHGFAVDENNRKMSKSLGNIIEPQDIICGKDKKPAYGIDVLRWWVANHTVQHTHIPVTKDTFEDSKQCIQKIRAIARFLLGNLRTYNVDNCSDNYSILDKYMLHHLFKFHKQVSVKLFLNKFNLRIIESFIQRDERTMLLIINLCIWYYIHKRFEKGNYLLLGLIVQSAYDRMDFNSVCFYIIDFVSNKVSSTYIFLVKDRLYCDFQNADRRIAAQQICAYTLNIILRSVAAILPHFVEEVYSYYPTYSNKMSYFRNKHLSPPCNWYDENIVRVVEVLFKVKEKISSSKLSNLKLQQCSVTLYISQEIQKILQSCTEEEILEILQISSVKLMNDPTENNFRVLIEETNNTLCQRCRNYTVKEQTNELCSRCFEVVNSVDILK